MHGCRRISGIRLCGNILFMVQDDSTTPRSLLNYLHCGMNYLLRRKIPSRFCWMNLRGIKITVSTGIFSTQMLFDVLRLNDQNELAYTIANQRDYPGWGFMLQRGATTLWETWKYPDNAPSQNHPMFGSVSEWFYRSLLGINPALPGFKKSVIKPQPAGDLTWAKGSYRSVMGTITSDWKKSGDRFELKVSIPPNTTAEVWIKSG